jgi:hypothetical protein
MDTESTRATGWLDLVRLASRDREVVRQAMRLAARTLLAGTGDGHVSESRTIAGMPSETDLPGYFRDRRELRASAYP